MDGLAALNAVSIQAQTTLPLVEAATNVKSSREVKTPTSVSIDPVQLSPEAIALQEQTK